MSDRDYFVPGVLAGMAISLMVVGVAYFSGAGTARQNCYGNGTCNAGLVCASDTCVALPDAGAPEGKEPGE